MEDKVCKKGRLEVVCGSMFSGKSEELIRQLKRSKIAQQNVVAFKHNLDDRKTIEYVISHDGSKIKAFPIKDPNEIYALLPDDVEVIGVDEVQFFSNSIVEVLLNLVDKGKRVVVAGLDMDFRGVPFGPMPSILAFADCVKKLNAVCIKCGQDAHFSQRIINGAPAKFDDPVVMVGAEECYQARCRACFVTNITVEQKSRMFDL